MHFDRDLELDIRIINALTPQALDGIVVSIHGHTLPSTVVRDADGAIVRAVARRAEVPPSTREFGVTLDVQPLSRPCDHGFAGDRRLVGVAVSWVEVRLLVT